MVSTETIKSHYEKYPYPSVKLFSRLEQERIALLNYRAGVFACFGNTKFAVKLPRILVVGCGTFEAIAVAKANPRAEITAIDISSRSLKALSWQLFFRGLKGRVKVLEADLLALPESLGNFDYIIATGVLHHLPDPEEGLRALVSRLNQHGILRLMIYSRHGREDIERLRDWRKLLGIENRRQLERALQLLPADHPFRLTYQLYSDSKTESGLHDGFFHVQERSYDALEMPKFLDSAGVEVRKFLHKANGQPSALNPAGKGLSIWEKIAVLDRWNSLEENFLFFAARKSEEKKISKGALEINEALIGLKGKNIYSRILDRILNLEIMSKSESELIELEDALFATREGEKE